MWASWLFSTPSGKFLCFRSMASPMADSRLSVLTMERKKTIGWKREFALLHWSAARIPWLSGPWSLFSPKFWFSIFSNDLQMSDLGIEALKIYFFGFVLWRFSFQVNTLFKRWRCKTCDFLSLLLQSNYCRAVNSPFANAGIWSKWRLFGGTNLQCNRWSGQLYHNEDKGIQKIVRQTFLLESVACLKNNTNPIGNFLWNYR